MLSISTETKNNIIIIHLKGELDINSTHDFKTATSSKLAIRPSTIALNMSGLNYIDSSGIGALVKLNKDTHAAGIHLILFDLEEGIRNMFKLSRLETIFTILTGAEFFERYLSSK
ncbi:MAG: STAS domain-containing protein [Spirochaetes bacterium]|nr:STAS domain-containing protein [Spirochaetota bacterium]